MKYAFPTYPHELKSKLLKEGYIEEHTRGVQVIEGATRSLDYSSHSVDLRGGLTCCFCSIWPERLGRLGASGSR